VRLARTRPHTRCGHAIRQNQARFRWHPAWSLAFTVLFYALPSHPAWGFERDKSDVVLLRNGNDISGDIVSLRFGMLRVKTNDMSTLSIKWPAVRSIASKFSFAVETRSGVKIYGPIETSKDGTLLIVGNDDKRTEIRIEDVERIDQYSPTFWKRINGNLAVGFSYTKSSAISVGSVNFDSSYRSTAHDVSLVFSSNSTTSADGATTNRDVLSSSVLFLQQSRNFWGLVGSAERDQELGIDARLVGGAVLGRHLVEGPHTELTGTMGVVGSQEWIAGSSAAQTNLEGVIGAAWRVFKFTDPETTVQMDLAVYPGISDSGRYRATGNLSVTCKVVGDLTVGMTGYLSYDSRPPQPTAQTSDYGVTFNLGYSFGR
jgi:Protein of unknown function, DUF481